MYQFRYSLVDGLRRLASDPGWSIALETVDDIAVASTDGRSSLLQLKMRAPGSLLTDASPDLWKTLRVCATGVDAGDFDPIGTTFYLVTTADLPTEGVASLLAVPPVERDVDKIRLALEHVASTSKSVENRKSYEAFLALDEHQRDSIIRSIQLLANQSGVMALRDELAELCRVAVRREHLTPFLDRLEGWWARRCMEQMTTPGSRGVTADELESILDDLRDQFRASSLPIDFDLDFLADEEGDASDRHFVQQLHDIDISAARVRFAVRDYFKAFTQRSRWSRDGLLLVGELEKYERLLTNEWERMFERMKDELGPEAAENEKLQAARALYAWVETLTSPTIRPECTDPFVCRGSFQMLADELAIGWHPDFVVRLAALLEPATGS